MADISITFTADHDFIKQDPDCSTCVSCENIIYGPTYVMFIVISADGDIFNSDIMGTDIKFCENCYSEFNKIYNNNHA